jgi:hypothetical protein
MRRLLGTCSFPLVLVLVSVKPQEHRPQSFHGGKCVLRRKVRVENRHLYALVAHYLSRDR